MTRKQPVPSTSILTGTGTANEFAVSSLAETRVGDLIVAEIIIFASGRKWTAPGWTQVGSTAEISGGGQYAVFWRLAVEAGERSYPITINQSAVSGAWATTRLADVDQVNPVVGGGCRLSLNSTTVKWASATPGEVPCMDFLLSQAVEEDTLLTPEGFTAFATGTDIAHSFGREYASEAATGETAATQSVSTPFGTARIFVLGSPEEEEEEEEEGPEVHSYASSVSGGGGVTTTGRKVSRAKSAVGGGGAAATAGVKRAGRASAVGGGGGAQATGSKRARRSALVSGGGTAATTWSKIALAASPVAGGGGATAAVATRRLYESSVSGGGTVTTTAGRPAAVVGTGLPAAEIEAIRREIETLRIPSWEIDAIREEMF